MAKAQTTQNADSSGILYLLTNQAMPNMVKIGITTKTAEERMMQLYSTGVPLPFICEAAIEVPNIGQVENLIQQMFVSQRVNPKREFFYLAVTQAKALFTLIESILPLGQEPKDVTDEVQKIINTNVEENEKNSIKNFNRRRPKMRFDDMGINVGSKIVFVKDSSVEAIVVENNRVKYLNGEDESLTALTQRLLNSSYGVQPSPFWTYEGKNLSEIYEETYIIE